MFGVLRVYRNVCESPWFPTYDVQLYIFIPESCLGLLAHQAQLLTSGLALVREYN